MIKNVYKLIGTLYLAFIFLNVSWASTLNEKFNASTVSFTNGILTVSTGAIERQWKLTSVGLKTIAIRNLKNGKIWSSDAKTFDCDWSYNSLVSETTNCNLVSITAKRENDEGFTSDYLNVVAEFEYPSTHTFIKYQIWAYPNASGLRTQVWIKGKSTAEMLSSLPEEKTEGLIFKLNSGEKINNYAACGISKVWDGTFVVSDKNIEYQLFGMEKNKTYKLGFSWWDFEGIDRIQKVKITSVDGELQKEILAPTVLPNYVGKKEMPKSFVLDIPENISVDGSIRIIFESANGAPTTVGEIWSYEKSGIPPLNTSFEGDEFRIRQLKDVSSDSFSLVAYSDCGNEPEEGVKALYGRCDYIPISTNGTMRLYAGYYNDTQHRNYKETPLLKEEFLQKDISGSENNDWASMVMVQAQNDGIAIIKESHKCVNQYGVETGDFITTPNGIENRGTSLYPKDLSPETYKWFWASWTVLWNGDIEVGRLAIKQFDRTRYNIVPNLDIYIMANTWGSGRNKMAAKEQNVLKEIDCQAKLGIDIQQIDDGWQDNNWLPSKESYPIGWGNVVKRAHEKNVKLGLWGAAMPISFDALKSSYDKAHFTTYKLDFANLSTHDKIDETIGKIRNFILYTDHNVRVNWDVTENAPRYGYFWAREYGSVYLENRKTDKPANAVYVPYLVLRDLWHLSKYTNLNKFQGSIQDVDRVVKSLSDASLYSHAYATVIPLMSTPLFFQETQFLTDEAVNEITPILEAYKKVRNEMYQCFVSPIGNEPNNETWSGFQASNATLNKGYLTIFREINSKENEQKIKLNFLVEKRLKITDLLNGKSFNTVVDKDGFIKLNIDKGGDFRFYKYEID